MGLFSFVKSAGRMLGLGHDATQDESKPAPPPPAADAVKEEFGRLGLPADVSVAVDGDKVKVSGNVADQATREKIVLASGNIAGVAAVEDELQVSSGDAGTAPVFHTVVKGDTLSAISKKHYGSANKYHQIFEANKPMLKDPDKIYPGQVLRIPSQ